MSRWGMIGKETFPDRVVLCPLPCEINNAVGQAVENSPFLEKLEKKDLEVLYMVEALDEMVVQSLPEFEEKK